MNNIKLKNYLEKRLSQPTVILCFRIILDNAIKNGFDSGMTKSQIAKIFNKDHTKYGIQNFKTDYILRQTGTGDSNAIYEKNGFFFIDKSFVVDLSLDVLKSISKYIDDKFDKITQQHLAFYEDLRKKKELEVSDKYEFIKSLLLEKETDKKGQCFEIVAFAILKSFYSIRGFELNRFSTIYSNDGGIDYTSQTSIYQVTTNLSDTKFEEDILKAPLKKRILVYKKAVTGFDFNKFNNELISDFISLDDLLNHLNYLSSKNSERHLNNILDVIIYEFKREYYIIY